jgi:hypothetical protein
MNAMSISEPEYDLLPGSEIAAARCGEQQRQTVA